MRNKAFLTIAMTAAMLSASAQTASFSSFTYQGRDARFDKQIDPQKQYLNPVVSGFYPDPSVCRVGDTYWLVNSTFAYFPGVPLFKSHDLVNWHQVGNVLDRPSQLQLPEADVSGGIFAPQIAYNPRNKTYYMTTMNMTTYQVFYVTSQDPEQGWSEPVQMKHGGMDTSFFFDTDGRAWVVYCTRPFDKSAPPEMSAIHMNEFDWKADSIKDQTWELTTGSGCMEKTQWIEGPHLYHIGKYYYLMCAEGGTERNHSEVIFRADKVTGPWESYSGNPILTQRDLPDTGRADPVSCAGHANLVQAEDGNWWAVFLACRPYDYDLYNTGRETFLLPVTWTDGWPVILPKGESVPTVVSKGDLKPDGSNEVTGNISVNERFTSPKAGVEWLYLRNPHSENYSFGNGLQLQPTAETLSGKGSPTCLFFRQKNTAFTAETEVTFQPADSAVAGIAAFQSDQNHLVLGKTLVDGHPAITLTMTNRGKTTVIGSAMLPESEAGSPVRLRIDGDGRYYSFSYAVGAGGWQAIARGVDCVCLSKTYSGGFVGTTIGLYASLKNRE